MSAFVCQNDHFVALAQFAISNSHGSTQVCFKTLAYNGLDDMSCRDYLDAASYFANVLRDENIRSVSCRYNESAVYPEPLKVSDFHGFCKLSAVNILKMCDCLEYQSCETDDYKQTKAYTLLQAIRGAAIRALPGYDDGPWDYSETRARAA